MKKIILFLINFIILLFIVYASINEYIIFDSWTKTISFFSIFLLIIQLITFKLMKFEIWSFQLWFIMLLHIFMFGRIYLNALAIDGDIFWNLIVRYDNKIMLQVAYFILLSIQIIFLLSVILKKDIINYSRCDYKQSDISLFYTGVIILLISFPIKVLVDLREILESINRSQYSSVSTSSGLLIHISMLVLPGVLSILFSGKLNRKQTNMLMFASLLYLTIPIIFTGDRRYSVIMIMTLVLSYMKEYDIKINIKIALPIIYLVIIFLNFLMVIRNNRLIEFQGLGKFFLDNLSTIFFGKDFLYQTLSEFGLSFFSIVNIFMYIPSQMNYYHGYTFVAMIPSILPIGWAFPDFFAKASLSNVINPLIGYPVGATLIGDFYGNFGYIGGLVMLGVFYGAMLRILSIIKKPIRLHNTVYFSLFFIFINLIRATPFEMFRPMIMYLLFIYLIYRVCNKVVRKKV